MGDDNKKKQTVEITGIPRNSHYLNFILAIYPKAIKVTMNQV